MANLPYRLLAIGNRIDLFKAESIHNISDAGEGRFVFVNTSTVNLPVDENETEQFWKIHEQSNISDNNKFTLIFEYGQPASFATLSKWAKDWHALEVKQLESGDNFLPTKEYLNGLADLTARFSAWG